MIDPSPVPSVTEVNATGSSPLQMVCEPAISPASRLLTVMVKTLLIASQSFEFKLLIDTLRYCASAVSTPFVALFGPTDPARHIAPSKNCVILCKSKELRCSPCYKPECRKRSTCMHRITVDETLEAIKGFLAREKA